MKHFKPDNLHFKLLALVLVGCVMMQQPAHATLFGQGDFGDSTFGSQSSLSMAFSGGDGSGNAVINLTDSGSFNFNGSGSANVIITSNNAVGYRLYLLAPTSTSLTRVGSADTITASGNSSPSTLAANTWGFNTTGSTTNFQGILSTPTEIKVTSEPYTSGDTTAVTYGVKTDVNRPAGTYTGSVVYTAVNRFED